MTWFGNHGGEHADYGMLDLKLAAPALEALARRLPLRLRVISNHRAKFVREIAPLPFPTEYCEWHPLEAHRRVRESDVVILPSTLNEFTRCKSANRALLALGAGVPVVATRTPATAALEGCVLFDDWERGIESYLADPALREAHLARARALIEQSYSAAALARDWRAAFERARALAPAAAPAGGPPTVVFLVNLVQDLELILPLYRAAARRPGWRAELWATSNDLLRRPEMHGRLQAAGVRYSLVDGTLGARWGYPRREGIAALVSASESTADPHLHAHEVVRWARARGVRTYTLQHGFQNIGLTYGDERFPVESVRFASDVVFLWGTLDSLHPRVAAETRAKCVPIGCPKLPQAASRALPVSFDAPLVAVFENLHSARYVDAYRERFLEDLRAATRARPDLRFLVRPHPAGRWLTTRHRGPLELPANVVLADARTPGWLEISSADIVAQAAAVITSVTTAALDAARAGKPVAVCAAGYRRDLTVFEPLPLLQGAADWEAYLRGAVDRRDPALAERARAFAGRAVLEGDAVERILEAVARDAAA